MPDIQCATLGLPSVIRVACRTCGSKDGREQKLKRKYRTLLSCKRGLQRFVSWWPGWKRNFFTWSSVQSSKIVGFSCLWWQGPTSRNSFWGGEKHGLCGCSFYWVCDASRLWDWQQGLVKIDPEGVGHAPAKELGAKAICMSCKYWVERAGCTSTGQSLL